MVVRGDVLTDKDNAGAAIIEACKEIKDMNPVEIGSYRGMTMYLTFDHFKHHLTLKGEMSHTVELGTDARGNLTRIENALAQAPARLDAVKAQLDNLYQQQVAAKAELGRPFPQEAEHKEKNARLAALNAELDIDNGNHDASVVSDETVAAKRERPSVLAQLRDAKPFSAAPPHTSPTKQMEVR